MATGYINPQLLAVLAAQGVKLPGVPQNAPGPDPLAPLPPGPQGYPQPDPLAPLPMATPPEQEGAPLAPLPQEADSINDGINSVGRPSDEEGAAKKAYTGVEKLVELNMAASKAALAEAAAVALHARS